MFTVQYCNKQFKQNTQMAKPSKQNKQSSSDDFVPESAISGGASAYLKFEEKLTKFRCISKPIVGWLEWIDKVPTRTQIDDEPEGQDDDNKPKKFMAMVVIDRKDNEVKILEMTQQSVIKAIKALAANPDWGNPFTYDITVSKTGEGMKTKYAVSPSPKKPLSKDDLKAASAKPCNLDALYDGENPWDVDGGEVTEYHFK